MTLKCNFLDVSHKYQGQNPGSRQQELFAQHRLEAVNRVRSGRPYVANSSQWDCVLRTMANPTSAFLRAGPSLVPSPVTATTSRFSVMRDSMIPLTSVYLSCGDDRASTRNFGQILSNPACETCEIAATNKLQNPNKGTQPGPETEPELRNMCTSGTSKRD